MTESFGKLLKDALDDGRDSEEDDNFELQSYTESVDSDDNVLRMRRNDEVLKKGSKGIEESEESSMETEVISFSQEVYDAIRKDKLEQIHLEMSQATVPDEIKPLFQIAKGFPPSKNTNSYQLPRICKDKNDSSKLLELMEVLKPCRRDNLLDAASFKEMARAKMPDQNFSRRRIERDYVRVHKELAHELDDNVENDDFIDVSAVKNSLLEGVSTVTREMIFGGKKVAVTQRVTSNTIEGKRMENQMRSRTALGEELSNIKEAMGKIKSITTLDKSAKEWENKKDADINLQQSLKTNGSDAKGIISKKRFIENQQYREFHDVRMKKRKIEIDMRRKKEAEWGDISKK